MFFYLSFLRPPPLQADPTRPLLITPQITNDLRTEFCHEEIDIFHAWVKVEPPSRSSNAGIGALSPPTKLTTWREATAYKEVSVFPPKGVKDNGFWQLLLCTKYPGNDGYSLTIDMLDSEENFRRRPLPVLSLPILFSSRNAREDDKQRNIERILRFPPQTSSSGVKTKIGPLKIREHLSFDLDKKVWDSGIGLSSWLSSALLHSGSTSQTTAFSPILHRLLDEKAGKKTLVELGAGTGLVSITFAALLSHLPEAVQVDIFATDLSSAMEVIEQNISLNKHCFDDIVPRPLVLDWDEDSLPLETREGVDIIVMADVTYNTASFPSLIRTLQRLSSMSRTKRTTLNDSNILDSVEKSGSDNVQREPPLVLLAYKERHPDERSLWTMVEEIGLHLEEIGKVPGAGGAPVEIYIGRFSGC